MTDMYIAACDKTGGIFRYEVEGERITEKQFLPLDRPMYMEIEGNTLYCVIREGKGSENSALCTFGIGEDGNLKAYGEQTSTLGAVGCHLAVNGSDIYVANYVSGSVFKTPDILVCHKGKGFNPLRQDAPHTHFVAQTPDKKYLLVCDLGLDKIFVYDLDLKPIKTVDFPLGAGPRHIAFSENGKYIYCVTELSNEVYSFKYNDGEFSFVQRISTLPCGFEGKNTAAAIRIRGDFLYVSNRGHNSITAFKISNGKMETLKTVSCGGIGPRDFNIFGDMLVCTNEESSDITFFKLIDNIPEIRDFKIKIKNPLNVIFKAR